MNTDGKPWIVLTIDDVNAYLVGAQVAALETAALADGQADPFGEIMPAIAARVRAEVRGCSRNIVSATPDSIPPDLKREALALIVEALQPRLLIPLSEDQKDAASNARSYLKRIASCEVPISVPIDPEIPDDVQKGGQMETVSKTRRRYSGRQTRGLL